MPELVPHKQRCDTIAKSLMGEAFIRQLKMALPKAGVTPDRLVRILITEVRRSERLSECSLISLMGALMQCAQFGLEPGPAGLAWIIPRRRKGRWEANFQLGYKGLCQLLWNSGKVSWINAQCVRKGDTFDYSLGAPPRVEFRPSEVGERGDITHVFAGVGTTTGGMTLEVWPLARLEEHRGRFVKATDDDSPWATDYEAMARKTLLIQAAKFAPLSIEAHRAIAADEAVDRGQSQTLDVEFEVELPEEKEEETPAPANKPAPEEPALMQLEAAIAERMEQFESPAKARTEIVNKLQKEFGKLSDLKGERLVQAIQTAKILQVEVK